MNTSPHQAFADRNLASPSGDEFRELNLDEVDQVGGGLWFLVAAIAIGCVLLLAHD